MGREIKTMAGQIKEGKSNIGSLTYKRIYLLMLSYNLNKRGIISFCDTIGKDSKHTKIIHELVFCCCVCCCWFSNGVYYCFLLFHYYIYLYPLIIVYNRKYSSKW